MTTNYTLHLGDCLDVMKGIDEGSVDMTCTSPPYDNLRSYGDDFDAAAFDWKGIIRELYRVTKTGGVVVWVVADATINGSETGTSFRQALWAMECGFNLHDTMIWEKQTFTATGALLTRYAQVFEYMFVFTKGKIETFNPIKDRPTTDIRIKTGTVRQADGTTKKQSSLGKIYAEKDAQRFNVWKTNTEVSNNNRFHPAQFPEALASDHILSWSNPGDVVFDPFLGSGTTGKMALLNQRKFIGVELDPGYFKIAKKRIEKASQMAAGEFVTKAGAAEDTHDLPLFSPLDSQAQ